MAAFWLGSVPALVLAGIGVQTLARLLGRRLPLATGLAIVLLGVVTLAVRMQTPVQAFEPKRIEAGAASIQQVEGLGKTVPPCCRKDGDEKQTPER